MAVALLGLTVSIYMLAVADSISEAFPAIVLYAISQGGIAVIPQALIADYFGRKAFATIAGLRSAIQMIGVIFGPIISGYVYDQTGNYKLAFIGLTACGIISFIFIICSC